MRNPLHIRVLRELAGEWKKYAVIFIFLTLMIGFVSGMYVANNSMLIATDRVKTEELREDGHFTLKEKADADLIEDIETGDKVDVRAYYVWDAYQDVSEEDVKNAFKTAENPCICPPDFPVCVCGRKSKGRVVTRKPILPSEEELAVNSRSSSAKLRIFERGEDN